MANFAWTKKARLKGGKDPGKIMRHHFHSVFKTPVDDQLGDYTTLYIYIGDYKIVIIQEPGIPIDQPGFNGMMLRDFEDCPTIL